MIKISNFQLTKFLLISALIVGLSVNAYAKTNKGCEYKTFNIRTSDKVSGLELLTQLAQSCNFSIVIKDDFANAILKKNLNSVNINDLTLDEIFELLIEDNDLYYKFDNNFLKISSLTTKTFKIDYITSIRNGTAVLNASVDSTPTEEGGQSVDAASKAQNMVTSNESFDFWSTISKELTSILNTGADKYKAEPPIINPNAGIITVTATKKQLDRIEKYIKILKERLHKQVLIDVSIISVTLENKSSTGINWEKFELSLKNQATYDASGASSSLGGNINFANNLTVISNNLFTMEGLLNFLKTNGETKIVSSPKILTLNNQQALITVGDNINYRVPEDTTNNATTTTTTVTTYKNYSIFIGVLLNITPEISENNEIILRINPSVSNFKYSEDDGKQVAPREIAPDTSEKKLSTVVKVKDGSTIILGGLITNSKGKDNSNVPVLSEIPLLGNAFKHTEDSLTSQELIFVIRPKIIGKEGINKVSLKELGFSKRLYE